MEMKRITLALAVIMVLVIGVVFTGCIRIDRFSDEGSMKNLIYTNLTGFTKIEIGNAFQLEVVPSDTYSVNITAGSNFLDKLDVSVRGDTLVFRLTGWQFVTGLLRFQVICFVGAVANVGIASSIYASEGRWWIAGFAGALMGVLWNYVVSPAFVWRAR